jgi:hypothetical protein
MLQDWRDVGPHTTSWTADRDDHARELAAQQQDFNENPFSDEHLQIRWAMMVKSELQEDTTDEGVNKALHDLSWIDLTEPDPKHNGAAMRNERLAPIWKELQGNEMTGLFERGCLKKVKRSELPMGTRVISSRFHYKIKRHSAGEHKLKVKRLKVRLVVQGQHMSKTGRLHRRVQPGTVPVWSAMLHVHGYGHEMEGRRRRPYSRVHSSRAAEGWKGHLYLPASRACRGARPALRADGGGLSVGLIFCWT